MQAVATLERAAVEDDQAAIPKRGVTQIDDRLERDVGVHQPSELHGPAPYRVGVAHCMSASRWCLESAGCERPPQMYMPPFTPMIWPVM